MKFSSIFYLAAVLLPSLANAQLSGSVGPLTTRSSKTADKICNVLKYGGVASKTSDVGPAIASAFAACKTGGTVYVPPGDYGMSTWVTLSGGSAWALQLDGVIYRTGTAGGNMFMIEHSTDFELYSSTSEGTIQGYGYVFHAAGTTGPRILRFYEVTDFSVHDIALVDSPLFHLSLDTCDSGELYNIVIRGGNEGGLDGLDVWSTNIHIHDIEVSNKDECVTVKSPSSNILIENIFCNWSGGCALGSLGADTGKLKTRITLRSLLTVMAISNVIYRNIYTVNSNQMLMIKSNGGSGSVTDCQFNNFIGHANAYSLDINAYWSSMTAVTGDGVRYDSLSFNNWKGTAANGVSRGPINAICPTEVPCTNITISGFAMWTDAGSSILYKCANAYGLGGCLQSGAGTTSYATITSTLKATPTGYTVAPTMPGQLTTLALSVEIAIPTIPTSFFPGASPASALLGSGGSSSSVIVKVVTSSSSASSAFVSKTSSVVASSTSTSIKAASTSKATSTVESSTALQASASTLKTSVITKAATSTSAAAVSISTTTVSKWGQCGGSGYSGSTTCVSGSTCVTTNEWYSQCL